VFTGDPSSSFLMLALHRAGFASQPTSEHRDDGLRLHNAYIIAALRCAPPGDRPTAEEMERCRPFLVEELGLLPNVRAVLALGRVAFDAYVRAAAGAGSMIGPRTGVSQNKDAKRPKPPERRPVFRHGAAYPMGEGQPTLFASYHPSPRNTNTGRLTTGAFAGVLDEIREFLEPR
jgi:uracil-DNA glycosylase